MSMSKVDDQINATAETVTIVIKDQAGEETQFKLKKTTKMAKNFQAYATVKGIQVGSFRFLLDGLAIAQDQTPKMLELEDGAQLEMVLAQEGGVKNVANIIHSQIFDHC